MLVWSSGGRSATAVSDEIKIFQHVFSPMFVNGTQPVADQKFSFLKRKINIAFIKCDCDVRKKMKN